MKSIPLSRSGDTYTNNTGAPLRVLVDGSAATVADAGTFDATDVEDIVIAPDPATSYASSPITDHGTVTDGDTVPSLPAGGALVLWESGDYEGTYTDGDGVDVVLGPDAHRRVVAGGDLETPSAAPGAVTPWIEQLWDYADTAAMDASPEISIATGGAAGTDVQLLTGQTTPWGGSRVCECIFPGGSGSQSAGVDWFLPDAATDKPREWWLEYYIRYDSDFVINSDHKTLFLAEEDNTVGANRWENKIGLMGGQVRINIRNGAVHEEKAASPPTGDTSAPASEKLDPSYFWDGDWHVVRWHTWMSTDDATADGGWRWYVDDVLYGESLNINTESEAGSYWDRLVLGANGDPVTAASMYWGRLRIWLTDPGWGY